MQSKRPLPAMVPFDSRFPQTAARETRSLHVVGSGGPMPAGEYGYLEYYCNEPGCDCRRVLLQVKFAQPPYPVMATINYGWESADFYTRWMRGDATAGREITAASLDPLHPQSPVADHLLDFFQKSMLTDPAYVARLARHYQLFKSDSPNESPLGAPDAPPPPDRPMTVPEILRQLQQVPERCEFAPYESALRSALDQREAIVPELIAAIDRVVANPRPYLQTDSTDYLRCFALYLLAQFRETRALDCFLRFFSLPGETALDLTGDLVTEHGAAVLASVCGGDPGPLLKLVHDDAVNAFVRDQALAALAVQCVWGERPRAAVIADLRRLFSTLSKPGDSQVWSALVCVVNDFNALELLPEVRQAYAENLVDEDIIGLNSFEPELTSKPRYYVPPSREQIYEWFCERNSPVDAIAECSMWLCFRDEDKDDTAPWDADEDIDWAKKLGVNSLPPSAEWLAPPAPSRRVATPKIGRNEACPCGSGKKYKKCCGKA